MTFGNHVHSARILLLLRHLHARAPLWHEASRSFFFNLLCKFLLSANAREDIIENHSGYDGHESHHNEEPCQIRVLGFYVTKVASVISAHELAKIAVRQNLKYVKK